MWLNATNGRANAGRLPHYSSGTCEIVQGQDGGLECKIVGSDVTTFVKRSDLSRDRAEQRPERFAVGDKVDAQVLTVDRSSKRSMPAMTASHVSCTTSSALAPVRTNVDATRRSEAS